MNLFVVIATCQREALLARTFESLSQCRRPHGFRGVLVVENGRRGETERVVREAPAALDVRYLFEPAGNKCRALNAALARIYEGLVVFLDDDVRVETDLLERYAAAAQRAGSGHFFGGPVQPDYEEAPPEWLTPFLPPSARTWQPDESTLATKPFFLGFNWAAFAGDLRRAGGFDERLGPGTAVGIGDESDVQRRLVAAGVAAVCVPEALVYHWVPRARCSPQWALERAYRSGVRSGWLKGDVPGPAVAGYPLALVKSLAGHWLRGQLPHRGRDERFAVRAKYERQRGVLRGVQLRRADR